MNNIKSFIDKKPMTTFWLILLLQICMIIFWGCMKSNFHQDELYTFQSAHYLSGNYRYMHETDIFFENTWLNIGDFKGFLYVNDDSCLIYESGRIIINKIIFKNPYELLINIAEGVFSKNNISKWIGIVINIPFFILSQIIIFKLVYAITKDIKQGLLSICVYGFSSVALGFSIYTRFYTLALFLILLAFYLHYRIWNSKSLVKGFFYEIIAFISLYYSFKCSELAAVIAVSIFICFAFALLIRKRYRQFFIYISPGILGGFYVIDYSGVLGDAMFHPAKYIDGSGQPLDIMFTNAMTITKNQVIRRLYNYFDFLGRSLFGNNILFALIVFLLLILSINWFIKLKKKEIVFPQKSERLGFLYILLVVAVIYSIFGFIVSLWLPRYYALIYPEILMIIVILFWYLLKNNKKIYNSMVIALFFLGIVITNIFARIDNVFIEDRNALQNLEACGNIDNVIWNMDDYQIIMECVYQMPKDSRMYVCSEYKPLCFDDLNDSFLLWTDDDEPLTDEAIEDAKNNGYKIIEHLGIIADANIYYVEKLKE